MLESVGGDVKENQFYTSHVDEDEEYRRTMNLVGSTSSEEIRRSKKQKRALRKQEGSQ